MMNLDNGSPVYQVPEVAVLGTELSWRTQMRVQMFSSSDSHLPQVLDDDVVLEDTDQENQNAGQGFHSSSADV